VYEVVKLKPHLIIMKPPCYSVNTVNSSYRAVDLTQSPFLLTFEIYHCHLQ